MRTYSYTIFDGDPSSSGPCAWPSHEGIEIEAVDGDSVMAMAMDVAARIGGSCGEYQPGDPLWITVWDDNGVIHATRRIEVTP